MLDDSGLRELLGDDEDAIRAVLEIFSVSSKKIYDDIAKAATLPDHDALQQSAHKFKSAAYSIGATALGNACQALEAGAHELDKPATDDLVKTIATQLRDIETYLNSNQ